MSWLPVKSAPMMLALSFVLIIVISHARFGEASDRKRLESLHTKLFDNSGQVQLNVREALEELNWAWSLFLAENGSLKGLVGDDTVGQQLDDVVKSVMKIISRSTCSIEEASEKMNQLQNYKDANYANLYPVLEFVIQEMMSYCEQNYESARIKRMLELFKKESWAGWFELTDELAEEDEKFALIVGRRAARYLKRYVPQVESKYFASLGEQRSKIANELGSIIGKVCQFAEGQINDKFSPQFMKFFDNQRVNFGANHNLKIWSNGRSLCKTYRNNVFDEAQNILNDNDSFKTEMIDKKIEEIDFKTLYDLVFAREEPTLRLGLNSYELVVKLHDLYMHESTDGLSIESGTLIDLKNLSKISDDFGSCSKEALEKRLELGQKFDSSYILLHNYVASMNALQYGLCNQILRNKIIEQMVDLNHLELAKFEELRSLVFGDNSDSTEINKDAFSRGMADFIYTTNIAKLTKRMIPAQIETEMNHICRKLLLQSNVVDSLNIRATLISLDQLEPLSSNTIKYLQFGSMCSYYRQATFDVTDIQAEYETSSLRFPEGTIKRKSSLKSLLNKIRGR